MSGEKAVWRCFWAAVPTRASCDRLAGALANQADDRQLRWIPAENWHITVCFLGDLALPAIQRLKRLGSQHPWQGDLALQVMGIRPFPSPRSRLLAVCFDTSEALSNWADRLGEDAQAAGLDSDRRPLRPHLTLARSRHKQPISNPPDIGLGPTLVCDRISLFRSELTPAGARYHPLLTLGSG